MECSVIMKRFSALVLAVVLYVVAPVGAQTRFSLHAMRKVLVLCAVLVFCATTTWADITSNLIFWAKLNEGSGTPVDSGSGAHTMTMGTSTAAPGWQTTNCHAGNCLSFDGGDTLTVADAADLSFSPGGVDSPFSITLWTNITDITAFQTLIAKYSAASEPAEWRIITATSKVFFLCSDSSDTTSIGRSAPLTTGAHQGAWIHLAATYSGSETNAGIKVYINGTQVDTTDEGAPTYTGMTEGAEPVTIGYVNASGPQTFFTGRLDEVKIFRRELTQNDVTEDWQFGVATLVKRKRILLY
jgi:hypothetical protein